LTAGGAGPVEGGNRPEKNAVEHAHALVLALMGFLVRAGGEDAIPRSSPLVLSLEGQGDITLGVEGRRIEGRVRGAEVRLEIRPREIEGRLAGEPVWIWMHGDEAEGHIGGHAVGFTLAESPAGNLLLQGTAVGHTVRLERWFGLFSWLPGCESWLLPLPRGPGGITVYQGACDSGRRLRLTVPDAIEDLPPLPRFIVLSLLLTEDDEAIAARGRHLFPAAGQAR
jgi:hypothetical protein